MRCDGAADGISLPSGDRASECDHRCDGVEARIKNRHHEASQSVIHVSFFRYDQVLQQDSYGIDREAVAEEVGEGARTTED